MIDLTKEVEKIAKKHGIEDRFLIQDVTEFIAKITHSYDLSQSHEGLTTELLEECLLMAVQVSLYGKLSDHV